MGDTARRPSLLGDKDKGIEIVYGKEKLFCIGPTRASKAEQKSLVPGYRHNRPKEPTKEGPLYLSTHKPHFQQSPCRGHPSLVSLLRQMETSVIHMKGIFP